MQTEVKVVRFPGREKGTMRRIKSTAAVSMAMLALTASTASAATKHGTNYGDALYGTNYADTIYGYGGADLIKGYGGVDSLYGGNEAGWGDKILGGAANDRVLGQNGNDALYGESGNDRIDGGYGNDLIVGGYGEDTLNAGPGADRINAQDGQRDTIELYGSGPYDVVYYDRGLDVLIPGPITPQGSASKESAGVSAAEASKATDAKLLTERPPAGLFEHTGKVLVEHKGKEKLVAEKELKGHVAHGDRILDPTGRAGAGEGRR